MILNKLGNSISSKSLSVKVHLIWFCVGFGREKVNNWSGFQAHLKEIKVNQNYINKAKFKIKTVLTRLTRPDQPWSRSDYLDHNKTRLE